MRTVENDHAYITSPRMNSPYFSHRICKRSSSNVSNIKKSSPYLKVNTTLLHYKDQLINDV
jgi:hypothetical protein